MKRTSQVRPSWTFGTVNAPPPSPKGIMGFEAGAKLGKSRSLLLFIDWRLVMDIRKTSVDSFFYYYRLFNFSYSQIGFEASLGLKYIIPIWINFYKNRG
jgi:hypothetical protein